MAEQAPTKSKKRRVNWAHTSTVISAAILIGVEVFGVAYAGGWALGFLLGLGDHATYALQTALFAIGVVVTAVFFHMATSAEPIFTSENADHEPSD